ncbi:hypothetical protein B296_00011177 [Ensete ventricosum]|uniref:Transcription initiation factor TFIID subunit 1 histone acetyltransferase domain-containing protein n=1 Tax=Ensete ventricosum TaxID=4639 RepID=A0A427AUU2_ENSVE|nr:hypothetical protein B296_00011177 [Ensete ventricosum]
MCYQTADCVLAIVSLIKIASYNPERVRTLDVADIVEEDEVTFLRSSSQNLTNAKNSGSTYVDFDDFVEEPLSGVDEKHKDLFLCAQPMKDDIDLNMFARKSPVCPDLYPFDQLDWENDIVWGNSPEASHDCSESCVATERDVETSNDAKSEELLQTDAEVAEQDVNMPKDFILVESFGSRNFSISRYNLPYEANHPPRSDVSELVSRRDILCSTEVMTGNRFEEVCKSGALGRLNKLSLLNKELLEGSWLDNVIWDSDENIPKPKLILDLQDDQMLFEILDNNARDHLRSHAGAMMINRSSQSFLEDSFDPSSQGIASAGRFNISNDKYYSNRKTSQQTKSHAKKRTLMSLKVMHSVPALKLQTMKPKLC